MFTDVKEYREALSLVDEVEDPDLKGELADQIRYFEHDYPDAARKTVAELTGDEDAIAEQRQLGGVQQSSRVETSKEALKRSGFKTPRNEGEYGTQRAILRAPPGFREDYDPETLAEMEAGQVEAWDTGTLGVNPVASPYPSEAEQAIEDFKAQQAAEESGEEGEPDPYQAARKEADEEYHQSLLQSGEAHLDPKLATASKRTDLAAPPEHLPGGASLTELLQTQPWLEPSLDVVKEIFRKQGHNVDSMTTKDPRYQRFSDAAWKAEYLKAKKEGRPVVRFDYMSGNDWKRQAYKAQAIALNEVVGPAVYGADKSLSAGLVTEAMSGLLGEDARKAAHATTERSPVVSGAGQVVGAFAPGGLAAKIYGAAARKLAPAGTKGLQRVLGAGAAAGVTGAAESVGTDLVRNLGEKAFSDNPQYRRPGEIAERAGMSALLAAPVGAGADLLGSLAAGRVKALREGRRGKAVADLEQAGMSTGQAWAAGRAWGQPEKFSRFRERAGVEQRMVEDVIADDVIDGLSADFRKRGGGGAELARPDVLKFRSGPGREAMDEALLSRADDAGVAEELRMMPALKALKEIEEAAQPRLVGHGGGLSVYGTNPFEMAALKADPLMRALSRRESARETVASPTAMRISEDLLNFLRSIVRPKTRGRNLENEAAFVPPAKTRSALSGGLNPLRDIAEGRAGRMSARQLGAGASGIESGRRERYTLADLTFDEREALTELLEAMTRSGQLPAAMGE